jgi:nucleoside permease NupC
MKVKYLIKYGHFGIRFIFISLKNQNIDISKVHSGLLTYLLINCSAQVIFQKIKVNTILVVLVDNLKYYINGESFYLRL